MISTESSRHLTFVKYGVIVVKTYYFIDGLFQQKVPGI